jgi:predicted permease
MIQNLGYAIRMLRKSPGFTVVAVCSLAIGIGANSAIFSLADAILLRPLPVLHASEVVSVNMHSPSDPASDVSYRDYVDFRDKIHSFTGLIAFNQTRLAYRQRPDAMTQMRVGFLVSGNLFRDMGVEPTLGRGFREDEDRVPGRDAVVVLSHDFWLKEFSGDASVIGRQISLNGTSFTIVGVAPEHFTGLDQYFRPALFVPLAMSGTLGHADLLEKRGDRELAVRGRLKAGVTIAQAQAELNALAKGLEREHPDTNWGRGVVVQTELERRIKQSPPDSMLVAMMMTLSLCVLLVACANVAGLQLSRARARTREMAVRLAIGAKRRDLIRQLLTESLLVALLGGTAGILIAYGGVIFLGRITIPTDLPIVISPQLDNRVLLVTLLLSLASTVLFGLVPAIGSSRVSLVPALKAADADSAGGRRRRLTGRNLLVIGQIAVSLMLLSASGFMFRAISRTLGAGPGFRVDHLLTTSYDPTLIGYSSEKARDFYKRLANDSEHIPGVTEAALCQNIPMGNEQSGVSVVPEGFQLPRDREAINLFSNTVDEHYFDVMGIPVFSGRPFRATDNATSPPVVIVNEEFARRYFPNQNAVGRRVRMGNARGPALEVVGVVKTTKVLWIAEPPTEFVYLPYAQNLKANMTVVLHTNVDAASITPALRAAVRNIDPNQPVFDVRTMEYFYQKRAVEVPKMIIQTTGTLGLMGLVLAVIGLYGLVAFSASRRTREIGLRMAIGADRWSVLKLVLRQGLLLASAGVAIGLVLSGFAGRGVRAIFSGDELGIGTMLIMAAGMMAVSLIAAYAPAHRASRLDPMKVLRDE